MDRRWRSRLNASPASGREALRRRGERIACETRPPPWSWRQSRSRTLLRSQRPSRSPRAARWARARQSRLSSVSFGSWADLDCVRDRVCPREWRSGDAGDSWKKAELKTASAFTIPLLAMRAAGSSFPNAAFITAAAVSRPVCHSRLPSFQFTAFAAQYLQHGVTCTP